MANPEPADKKPTPRSRNQAPTDATAFQRFSAPLLVGLSGIPRWAFVIGLAATTFAGLAIEGVVGGVLLLVVAVFLGWLAALGWPSYTLPARILRVAVVALVAYVAATKLFGFNGG